MDLYSKMSGNGQVFYEVFFCMITQISGR